MAYGIWIKSLEKWMIDGYDHKKNEEIPSLFKLRREAMSECDILNRDWYKSRKGMRFKMKEDYIPKMYRRKRKTK